MICIFDQIYSAFTSVILYRVLLDMFTGTFGYEMIERCIQRKWSRSHHCK